MAISLIYRQNSGELIEDVTDRLLGICYSGRSRGLNNAAVQDLADIGPIPRGIYRIGAAQCPVGRLGVLAFPLTPLAGNDMLGRGGFLIHGDNSRQNHTASEGCIIAAHAIREQVVRSVGSFLTVVSGYGPAVPAPQYPSPDQSA